MMKAPLIPVSKYLNSMSGPCVYPLAVPRSALAGMLTLAPLVLARDCFRADAVGAPATETAATTWSLADCTTLNFSCNLNGQAYLEQLDFYGMHEQAIAFADAENLVYTPRFLD